MGPPPGSKRPVDIRGPMVPGPPVGPGSAAAAAAAAAAASKNASSKKKRRLADKILPQKVRKYLQDVFLYLFYLYPSVRKLVIQCIKNINVLIRYAN